MRVASASRARTLDADRCHRRVRPPDRGGFGSGPAHHDQHRPDTWPAASSGALLLGRIFDDRGNRMSPSTAKKGELRYCYYASSVLAQGQGRRDDGLMLSRMARALDEAMPSRRRQPALAASKNAVMSRSRAPKS